MSQTLTIAPSLSPAFGLARKLSLFMVAFCALAFCVMLGTLILMTGNVLIFHFPHTGLGLDHGIRINWDELEGGRRIVAMVAADFVLIPAVMTLFHVGKLFLCFSRGEVFAARPIAHMRAAGLWLIGSFFLGLAAIYLLDMLGLKNLLMPSHLRYPQALIGLMLEWRTPLLMGIPTLIAAIVMDEARRIAADHAEIV